MATSSFRIEPHDVLFFRDGKPSSLGEDHFHRSIFPPHSSTIYGAIRTRRLIDHDIDLSKLKAATWNDLVNKKLQDEIGTPQSFGTFSMRGPWLTRRRNGSKSDEILLPSPSDLGVILENSAEPRPRRVHDVVRYRADEVAPNDPLTLSHLFALLRPYRKDGASWQPYTVPPEQDDPSSPDGFYLTPAGMKAWLDGGVPAPSDFVDAYELWRQEIRTGVGLKGNARSSEISKLYTFAFVRLQQGVGLGFDVSDCALAPNVTITLGGEGKTATILDGPSLELPSRAPGQRFSVYLGTPAIFENGAVPDSIDPGTNEGSFGAVPCRLLAPICRKFDLIGGWNMAAGRSRPLRRAVPAGTVLLFERTGSRSAPSDREFMNADLMKQGFGLSIVGTVT